MSAPLTPKMKSRSTIAVDSHSSGSRIGKFGMRAMEEARRFAVRALYLWVLFGLFALHQRIILRSEGVGVVWHGLALINALVLGKIMLVAEDLDLGRWAPRRPLIYPILLDAGILTILFIVFHLVERKIIDLFHGGADNEAPLGGGGLDGLLCVATIVFVSLIPFFAIQHLGRALGVDRLKAILFGKGTDLQEGLRD